MEISDARELFNSQHYFPRYLKDDRGQFELHLRKVGPGSSIEDSRIREFMTREMYEKGAEYEPVMDAFSIYLKQVYDKVITHRTAEELKMLRKVKEIPEEVKVARKNSRKDFIRLTKIQDVLEKMDTGGYWPSRGQWQTMKNALPTQRTMIDQLRQFKPEDLSRVISQVGQDVFRAARIPPEKFWTEFKNQVTSESGQSAGATPFMHDQAITMFKDRVGKTWYNAGPDAIAQAHKIIEMGERMGMSRDEFRQAEIDAFEEFWAAKGKTRQRHPGRLVANRLNTQTEDISAVDATLKELGVEAKNAVGLRTAVHKAMADAKDFEDRAKHLSLIHISEPTRPY